MSSPPLGELFELLRADGFAIGVDDHVRIGRLLACEAAWTPELLRISIAALLVTDGDEQKAFDACWERWMPSIEPAPPMEAVPPALRPPRPRHVHKVVMAGGAVAATVVAVLAIRAGGDGSSVSSSVGDAIDDLDSATSTGSADAAVAKTANASRQPAATSETAKPETAKPETAKPETAKPETAKPETAKPETAKPETAKPEIAKLEAVEPNAPATATTANPAVDGVALGTSTEAAGGSASAPSTTSRFIKPPLRSSRALSMARVGFVLGAIVLIVAAIAAVIGARRRRRFVPGPWRYALAVPRATRPVLSRFAIEDAAADLTWQASEVEHELDLALSVAATVARGGLPTLVHRAVPVAPRYVVLEDTAGGAERWSFVYDELFRGLVREGVDVERYSFVANLERCTGPDGRTIALGDLLDHADALIVIGDGDAAVDPLTGEHADWVVTLHYIPRRLWINPFPPARWSEGARAIAAGTPMEHGAAGALTAIRAGIDLRTHSDGAYPAAIERTPGTASAIVALRAALTTRAFRLVAAVSAVGPPTISLARWLAEVHELQLDEQDWLCVVTLPWFRTEQWPPGMPERLNEALGSDSPELSRSVSASSDRLLAASEPPPSSVAHLAWQIDGAYRAGQRGERRAAARVLNRITRTPLSHQARGRLDALGLQYRARVALILAVAVGGVLVAGATGYGMVENKRESAAWATRAAERRLEKVEGDGARLPIPSGASWPEVFAVRVLDGNGDPVTGAHVVWTDPQLGSRAYIGTTGADGWSRAAQLCPSPPRDDLLQFAQLIAAWEGEPFTDKPVAADGERAVFRFTQLAATPPLAGDEDPATSSDRRTGCNVFEMVEPKPAVAQDREKQIARCKELADQKQWQALEECAAVLDALGDPVAAQELHAKVAFETSNAARASEARQALVTGRLKVVGSALKKIAPDSVYFREISDAFVKAEDKEIERSKVASQEFAANHDCVGLQRYVLLLGRLSTERVAAASRAVACVEYAVPGPDCTALDVNNVMALAELHYKAGDSKAALIEVVGALGCSQSAKLYAAATTYACGAHDEAKARYYFANVPTELREGLVKKCKQDRIDPREPCDVADEFVEQAVKQYGAGYPKLALARLTQVLMCKQDERLYRFAVMYACSAHDLEAARKYFVKVTPGNQANLEQKCQIEGLDLRADELQIKMPLKREYDCISPSGELEITVFDADGHFVRTETRPLRRREGVGLPPCIPDPPR